MGEPMIMQHSRRRPTPPVVQSLVAGAQGHPGAAAVLGVVFVADERTSHLGLYTGAPARTTSEAAWFLRGLFATQKLGIRH